jgi:hypothetical protein
VADVHSCSSNLEDCGNNDMRTEVIRTEIQRLLRQAPFRPFALNLENEDRIVIEHLENIAFDASQWLARVE